MKPLACYKFIVIFFCFSIADESIGQCAPDTQAPTAVCVSQLNISLGFDSFVITAPMIDGGSTDNCTSPSGLDFSLSQTNIDCSDVGDTVLIIMTVTDASGNSNQCWTNVVAEDKLSPSMVCNSNVSVSLGVSGSFTFPPGILISEVTDNCEVSLSYSPAFVDCTNIGIPLPVFVTATDPGGNQQTCFSTITVEDKLSPSLVCNSNVSVSLGVSGSFTFPPGILISEVTDNCGVSLSYSPAFVDCTNIGMPLPVFVTATDPGGNQQTCFSTVTVEDKLPPTALCASLVNVSIGSDGVATLDASAIDAGSFDNCTLVGDLSFSISPPTVNCSSIGDTVVGVLTVTDESGNAGQCTVIILPEDKEAPTAVCKSQINIALGFDSVFIIVPMIDNGSTDNCTSPSELDFSLSQTNIDCSDVGDTVVIIMTVTDASGNSNQCWTNIVAEDKLSPSLVCNSNVSVSLGVSGSFTFPPGILISEVTDNCGVSLSYSPAFVDCTNIGMPLPVYVTATDPGGNQQTCFSTVTVEDKLPPTALCTSLVNVSIGSGGVATLDAPAIDAGSFDNCTLVGDLSFSISPPTVNCSSIGDTVVGVLTVTDESGNAGQCTVIILPEDKEAPTAVCKSQVNISLGFDSVFIIVPMIDNGSTDNCTSPSELDFSLSQTNIDCSDVGDTVVIIMTVTDASGNSNQCWTNIVVEDKLSPGMVCKSGETVALGSDGTYSLSESDLIESVDDNCGYSISFNPAILDCKDAGKTVDVTVTATDISGNFTQCITPVSILDPGISTLDILGPATIFCGESGVVFNAVVAGGTPPFSYNWSIKKGLSDGWSIVSGQGTNMLIINAGIKKFTLELEVTDVCNKSKKIQYKTTCSNASPVPGLLNFDINFDDQKNRSFRIFPNPAKEFLYLESDFLTESSLLTFQVFDISGKQILSKNAFDIQSGKIDISVLPAGIYYLKLQSDVREVGIKRFIKLE